jgi:hypothetical protein
MALVDLEISLSIPADYMVVGPDASANVVEAVLALANASMGAIFVGLGLAALEHALAYAQVRVQGGVPISEHPDVSDVFVYGGAAASGAPGEKDVVVAVVLQPGVAFDPAALSAYCRAGLEANTVPSYLQVVDEIPKTASEKPRERFLLDCFAPDAMGVWSDAPSMRSAGAAGP